MRKKQKANRPSGFKDKRNVTLALPATYRQLFKFTYKTNLLLLFKVSLMLSLFAIPLFLALYIRARIVTGLTAQSSANDLAKNVMGFQGWYGFVLLACFLVFSLGIAGALFVIKKHIRNEGVIFIRDFFGGIRKNGLTTMGITFFYFGILALLNYFINLFSFQSDIPYYAILLVAFIFVSVLLYMMWILAVMITMIYRCSFFRLLKNAFLMMFSRLPLNLLSLLCSAAPFIIVWAIGYAPVLYAFTLLYVGIGFGNSALVVALFNCYIFDETVNKEQFPEAYRQGLFPNQGKPQDEGFQK